MKIKSLSISKLLFLELEYEKIVVQKHLLRKDKIVAQLLQSFEFWLFGRRFRVVHIINQTKSTY